MDTPLIIYENDPKWTLLGKILATVASRRVKQEMAKHGIAPVNMAGVMLNVVLMLTYPLSIFNRPHPEKEKKFFNRLSKDLINILDNWKEYRPIRGMIEDIFKLAKNAFSLRKLHRYTERSVVKIICLNVLLEGVVVSLGFNSKEELQRMAEW
jgi:hypothetical protein